MSKTDFVAKGSEMELRVLDGLRGLMALWVVIGHTCHYAAFSSIPVIRSPKYAVIGFMLLSGFLMTYHYIYRAPKEPWTEWRTWIAFYIRRFFRISPVYYLLLAPAYLLANYYESLNTWICAFYRTETFKPVSAPINFSHVLLHVSYIFGTLPHYHASLILPDWSLSLEMQFYIAFPFLMLLALYAGWRSLLMLSAIIYCLSNSSIGFASHFMQPSPLPISILWFAIGMVWAWIYIENPERKSLWIVGSILLSLLSRDINAIALVIIIGWILFAGPKVSLGGLVNRVRKPLSGKTAKFLADASYCVYLLHLLLLLPVSAFIANHTHLSGPVRFLACFVPTVLITYILAVMMRPVETWGIGMGKKFAKLVLTSK